MTDNAPDGTTSLSQQELIKLKRHLRNYVARQMEGSPPGPEDPKQAVVTWLEQTYAQTQLNLDLNLRQSTSSMTCSALAPSNLCWMISKLLRSW
jgi:hypothetical protein